MRWFFVLIWLIVVAPSAWASEEVFFAPPPAWVVAVEPPAEQTEVTQGRAVAARLIDLQSRYDESGDHQFVRSVTNR